MTLKDRARKIVENRGGIAKSADFVSGGLKASDAVSLCDAGFLNRVRHGYYKLSDDVSVSDEKLLLFIIPKSIVCVESALFYYGYSDFTPRRWSVAVPRSVSRTMLKTESIVLKSYYIQPELYELGKTVGDFNGVTLSVYDRERTICDCFKYRSRIDSEMFSKAVSAYALDDAKNIPNLIAYARKLRVYRKVMDIMEVLLNG